MGLENPTHPSEAFPRPLPYCSHGKGVNDLGSRFPPHHQHVSIYNLQVQQSLVIQSKMQISVIYLGFVMSTSVSNSFPGAKPINSWEKMLYGPIRLQRVFFLFPAHMSLITVKNK